MERNPYNSHGASCLCTLCQESRMFKRYSGDSKNDEQMHLANAHSMHHQDLSRKHRSKAFGWRDESGLAPQNLSVEEKAKHLQAAAMHDDAADHFGNAARSYRDGLPKGAKEHMDLAKTKAVAANKISQDLGVA